jgi:zinc transporter ZupT
VWLVYWMHRAAAFQPRVVPYRDTRERGLFTLLAFAAAGFLYVALADLVPAQRDSTRLSLTLLDLLLVIAGIGVIALIAHGH